MHCFPPQNIEHWKAPGVTCRKCSEIREYFGPASLGTAEEDKVHFTSPELLASIVDKVGNVLQIHHWVEPQNRRNASISPVTMVHKHGVRC